MPVRPPAKESPAEMLVQLSLGYNGYTDPTLCKPQMWAPGSANCFSGAFGYVQRSRFSNVILNPANQPLNLPVTSMKNFALPGLSSYLLVDMSGTTAQGQLFSWDTQNYSFNKRVSPYLTTVASSYNGPWSREVLQNIVYEMNGIIKQSGRGANALTIESFGLDSPDASPQITINAGSSQTITNIQRISNVVTVTLGAALTVPGGNGIGFINVIITVGDTSFTGTFTVLTGSGTATLTWSQLGQNTSLLTPTGTVDVNITKSTGRSYAYAWENANKVHVGAPSPATQYIKYAGQNGVLALVEAGTVTTNGSTIVTGTNTAFTSAWIGRRIWVAGNPSSSANIIISVQSATQLTTFGGIVTQVGAQFQIYDPSATNIRLYATGDGQATYFRVQRNAFDPTQTTLVAAGLQFFDNANSEPPSFPFTSETAQFNNVPPPIGKYLNQYGNRLIVFGVSGAPQAFFYSNQETTSIGLPQESFAPLNQVTLPIQNAQINGMAELPGSLIIWSDKEDMFRLTGLLSDNQVSTTTSQAQGATISQLPYSLGCANPFAVAITPLGVIWMTSNAEIWLFTDRYAPRNIGRPWQDILSTISSSQMSLVRAKYYHTQNRNWMVFAVPANGFSYNNTLLVLDLDLLASNGSPSYFTFDMATNSPSWFVLQPGPIVAGNQIPRCDSLETVYEQGGLVRLFTGSIDLIQDTDFQAGFGTEIQVKGANIKTHAWGNDSAFIIKRPSWVRFTTNQDPSQLAFQGWTFSVDGIDDDFYTFVSPLTLALTPGANDTATLGGNPSLLSGSPFRTSPELFRIGGVNFVMGRRLRFGVQFPSSTGQNFQLRSIQLGFGAAPPR